MEKFEGNMAECLVKYIKAGGKGRITRNNDDYVVGSNNTCISEWYGEQCTYTPPEPIWKECGRGEALDAAYNKNRVQIAVIGHNYWQDIDIEWGNWHVKDRKFRKEV